MVLLPFLLILIVSEPAWRWWKTTHWEPDPADARKLDSLSAAWQLLVPASGMDSVRSVKEPSYFPFDPNTATIAQFVALGFSDRLANRIENYRKKGGVFKSKGDLLKIYGMDSVHYSRVVDYVYIAADFKSDIKDRRSDRRVGKETGHEEYNRSAFLKDRAGGATRYSLRMIEPERPFDINRADTSQLEAIRGIGEKLSRRIIKYRSSLGGFVRTGQLAEVFGLDSIVLAQLVQITFVATDFLPDRIDLNTADEAVLEAHPYVSRQEARAVVAYRFQHGRFQSVSELGKLPMFSDEKVRRLEPYLKVIE